TITVYAPPAVLTTSYPDAYRLTPYLAGTTGNGGKTPYTWSITAGALPAGLTIASGTGTLSGSPTGSTASFTVTLSDANLMTASKSLSIAVYDLPSVISSSPVADGYVGQTYSVTLAATGGKAPLTWSLTAGSLPNGLSVASTGVIGPAE